jgi:F0F1-type ATP synthase assembly protein I
VSVAGGFHGRYSVTPQDPEDGDKQGSPRSTASAESVAFLLLAGVAVGLGFGAGVDWLFSALGSKTFPLFVVIGVFVGFGLALYAVYLETK